MKGVKMENVKKECTTHHYSCDCREEKNTWRGEPD